MFQAAAVVQRVNYFLAAVRRIKELTYSCVVTL
jgi:hypothetical protein